jgi:hypothetical protein
MCYRYFPGAGFDYQGSIYTRFCHHNMISPRPLHTETIKLKQLYKYLIMYRRNFFVRHSEQVLYSKSKIFFSYRYP